MIWKAYSILDVRSDLYSRPFFMAARGEAIRAFSELANDPKSSLGKFPKDYKLVEFGSFDDSTCTFAEVDQVSLGMADEYVKAANINGG